MKNSTDLLMEAVSVKGLPDFVHSWGHVSESLTFSISGSSLAMVKSEELLKADFIVSNEDEAELAYNDLDSLKAVVLALINGNFSGEDLSVIDTKGSERLLPVQIDEPVTISHDFELLVSEKKFLGGLSQIGVDIEIQDLEYELSEICSVHCEEQSGEKHLSSKSGVAVVEFKDGTTMKFANQNGIIGII